MKSGMLVSAAAALLFAAMAGAQDLPATVTDPYIAYERALQSGDGAAAFEAARQAFRAGEAENIDRETLGLLAENYGTSATAVGEYAQAYDAWREAAQMGERGGLDPTIRAWRWHNAALNAVQAGEMRDAFRASGDAVDALFDLDELDGEALVFAGDAYFLNARLALYSGRVRDALDPALALIALRSAQTIGPDEIDANAHLFAGISQLVQGEDVEAGYHFGMSAEIADSQVPEVERVREIHTTAQALQSFARSRARDDADRIDERLAANPFYLERQDADDQDTGAEPGDADAQPIERYEPEYPRRAMIAGHQGVVVVEFDVDETGRVADPSVRVAIPPDVFDEAALEALELWVYEPAMQDGVPVRRTGVVTTFTFMLAN